jgi:hypothetical protein
LKLSGFAIAPGRVLGKAFVFRRAERRVPFRNIDKADAPAERERLQSAFVAAQTELADLRARLSVRVTASAGTSRADATSLQTDRVQRASTKVKVSVLDREVQGRAVRLRISLSAVGVKPRGTVVVRVGGTRVARVESRGRSTVRVPIGRGARHRVKVVFLGSKKAARATATVVVRRR